MSLMEQIEPFCKEYELHFGYLDCRGVARPSCLFDIAQDIATIHAREIGLDRKETAFWVLSRMKVEALRPLRMSETITAKTWCAGIKGATWLRCFDFLVGEERVGSAKSAWALIDPTTRRLLRPSIFEAAARYASIPVDPRDVLGKLERPALTAHHVHQVCYTDLDVNNHVNNTKLVELVSDGLDLNLGRDFVRSLQVNYTAESHFGECIEVKLGGEGSRRYVCGEVNGQLRFEGEAELATLPEEKGLPLSADE